MLCSTGELSTEQINLHFVMSCRRCNFSMGGSPGDVTEEPVTLEKRNKGWKMICDVAEAAEGLENELWRS